MEKGVDNTKFFHHMTNHRKNINTIYRVKGLDGNMASIHKDVTKEVVILFEGLFKENHTTTLVDVANMGASFPNMITREGNSNLTQSVSKGELLEVLTSF